MDKQMKGVVASIVLAILLAVLMFIMSLFFVPYISHIPWICYLIIGMIVLVVGVSNRKKHGDLVLIGTGMVALGLFCMVSYILNWVLGLIASAL